MEGRKEITRYTHLVKAEITRLNKGRSLKQNKTHTAKVITLCYRQTDHTRAKALTEA